MCLGPWSVHYDRTSKLPLTLLIYCTRFIKVLSSWCLSICEEDSKLPHVYRSKKRKDSIYDKCWTPPACKKISYHISHLSNSIDNSMMFQPSVSVYDFISARLLLVLQGKGLCKPALATVLVSIVWATATHHLSDLYLTKEHLCLVQHFCLRFHSHTQPL